MSQDTTPKSPYRIAERHRQAERACLACDRVFTSNGPWNRICPKCQGPKRGNYLRRRSP